jgi:hypothetical protein
MQKRIDTEGSAFGIRDVVLAGGDLPGAPREFSAGKDLKHERRNQPVAEQGDFL